MPKTILVSACLIGLRTRYDGQAKSDPQILDFFARRRIVPIPVCPEQLAGLETPRLKTFFTHGDGRAVLNGWGELRNSSGRLMNEAFLRGAEETLKMARLTGCKMALLKERSPSCGVHHIYLRDVVVPGCGVTTALLNQKGLKIFSEENLEELISELSKGTISD